METLGKKIGILIIVNKYLPMCNIAQVDKYW